MTSSSNRSANFSAFAILSFLVMIAGCSPKIAKLTNNTAHPLLIMAQRPTTSGYPIEASPFSGMFINSVVGWHIMSGRPISYDSMYNEFAVLKGAFKKFSSNFIYVFNDFPGDFWNDTAWNITAKNFANIAKVAKSLGFKGIIYDNEEYLPKNC